MDLVDTHCHLQFTDLKKRLGEIVNKAQAAHVTKMICVGTNLSDSVEAIEIAKNYGNVWASAGTHPHDAKDYLLDNDAEEKLRNLLKQPRVVAVGEIGLDYYRNISPKVDQQKALEKQIEIGLQTGLPFIFHVRDAWEDFWPIFDSYHIEKAVIHSFSTSSEHLEEVLSRGSYISLNGIMTFTKDEIQLEAAKKIPLDRLLLETDAPFLAPLPYRGKTCEPKHLQVTAEFLAELRGETLEQLASETTKNAQGLFGI